ncbi:MULTISPECIES: ferrous iron transport protein B [unclassified Breznakia]|uniref:ferrous iron transport protein B n=1 Tax=unclassified Breznakia TaxID=2623764 RepID=UPI00247569BB|nr:MULTISPECIES: ferrous iron transport protein B [unclassified Breznakia]MDH6367023.1 ferrous iron transport protein B [Breznakia sp. PH1-1]MDH6404205.1 ferrous iron transport protein B [Breznakia sp. PF1-11]MDH6411910.1 ferrous iron transport protein B [Breznakia sp. PFB1-11]MDH6414193.1 ferrous iron transport protein B [Breznakia sp. PFB1-14]MDH6415983.1 ferrous iron transport protein B [Breznakia sp. PFB1-4]
MKIALVGNPNSGKTTLFNELTGSTAKVGNWAGVTVDKKEGTYKKAKTPMDIIDLPGVYSLSPYTLEEVIARDYIVNEQPDAIINIVDATNLERNLYLTTQILETDIPVVIALNMMDVVKKTKDEINTKAIEQKLGVPVIEISALRGENIHELMNVVAALAKKREPLDIFSGSQLESSYRSLVDLFTKHNVKQPCFTASKVLENDEKILSFDEVKSLQNEIEKITTLTEDNEALMADIRYGYIDEQLSSAIKKSKVLGEMSTSDKIDKVLTNRIVGLPIFALIMFLIFHCTFSENFLGLGIASPGVYIQGLTEIPIEWISDGLTGLLDSLGASAWVYGLVIQGIVAGVGGVLSFIPQILLIFLFLSFLEDSGYMARVAFIMDRILRRFGLSGKAFLPLLTGFGCSVPAIMGARTLEGEKERKLTMLLVPYMSCGAKAPIWAIFAAAVFPNHADIMTFGIYFLGIFVAVISAILLKRLVFKGETTPFVMEMPTYHWPRFKNLMLRLWDKLKGYITRAGTVILASTIVLWFLGNFDFSLQMVEANSDTSILGVVADSITFIFRPLGFASGSAGWKAVVAILTGLVAKEAVVSTMGVLYTGMESEEEFLGEDEATTSLIATIGQTFTPLAAISFMAFNLLSIPCMAAVAALRAEMNDRKLFVFTMTYWVVIAWIVSFLIYNVGSLLGF